MILRDFAKSRDFVILSTFITLEISLIYISINLTLLSLNLIILLDIKVLLEVLFINLYKSFIARLYVIVELVRSLVIVTL